MAIRRRRRGFERTGACAPDQLGLSGKRSRELRLAVAWRAVAGEALAGRARAVRVLRGTLEVQVDERRWEEVVRTLLPRLAARLARRCPGLGVRRCRLLVQEGDSTRRCEALALDPEPGGTGPEVRESPREGETHPGEPRENVDVSERLAELGERYLSRAAGTRAPAGDYPD